MAQKPCRSRRQQPIPAKVDQRNELAAIGSNPHSYRDPAASDGQQPIPTRSRVGPFMPSDSLTRQTLRTPRRMSVGLTSTGAAVAPTLSALKSISARVDLWVGSGRLADNGGWRQPRGDRERSGPACARSRKERRFLVRRVGGQATSASASPPDATRPGRRVSPATSSAQPAAPPGRTPVPPLWTGKRSSTSS